PQPPPTAGAPPLDELELLWLLWDEPLCLPLAGVTEKKCLDIDVLLCVAAPFPGRACHAYRRWSTVARARRSETGRRSEDSLAPVRALTEHELPGKRDARRRRGVGEDRHRLGHAARDHRAAAVMLDDDLAVAGARQRALEPGLETRGLEVVQQVLGLVLEAQDADLRALGDVGERDALDAPPGLDRVAVRARLRVADRRQHPLLEHRGHRVLEALGLLVDLVPRDAEDV